MKKKILRSALSTTLGTALLFTVLIAVLLFSFLTDQAYDSMKVNLYQINTSMRREADPVDFLSSLSEEGFPLRITLIDPDGGVLYESNSGGSAENHMDRDEIRQAAEEGYGVSSRFSLTLNQQSYYAALRLEDGRILRLCETRNNVLDLLLSLLVYIFPSLLLVLAFASFTAVVLTKRIVAPINALDLDHPERNSIYPELQPLLTRMKAQSRSIQEYISTLDSKRIELESITSGMAEGLILLNTAGQILMMNRSARRILHCESAEGAHILSVSDDPEFVRVFQGALPGRHCDGLLEIDGSFYQLHVNPVYDSGHFTGLVAFIPDVTDHYLAEKNRRDFTANISHELKTPLTSIVGCAEIIKGGIAAQEDWPELVDCIHREGVRMTRLVEDILHLSRLDSGAFYGENAQIDLHTVAQEIIARFGETAHSKNVSIRLLGGSAQIEAPRRLVDEIIANLIDNAVKYNRDGGRVWVETSVSGRNALIAVRDDGIGVAPEDQPRIFERFFRADKSRSKETGGTGLGLSIVKHAVQRLGGTIRLRSTPGKGTEITVRFPGET